MSRHLPRLTVLAVAGALGLAGALVLALTSHHEAAGALDIAPPFIASASFLTAGLFAWRRRPRNHFGLLMFAAGATLLLGALKLSNAPVWFGAGVLVNNLFFAVLLQMLVAFPAGRLGSRLERRLVGLCYAGLVVTSLTTITLRRNCGCAHPEPRNAFLIANRPGVASVIETVAGIVLFLAATSIAVLLVRRWRGASRPQRRIIAPVLWNGATVIVTLAVVLLLRVARAPSVAQHVVSWISVATITVVPFAFVAGLLRSRYSRADAVGGLLGRLSLAQGSIRDAIAAALGDPTVQLLYWREKPGQYVDAAGRPSPLPAAGSPRGFVEVKRDGQRGAAIIFDGTLGEELELVSAVGSAAGLALDNERLQAELRARITELETSRTRVLEASLKERQRIERDLHDGAQQRFVSLALTLAMLDRNLSDRVDDRAALTAARDELDLGISELRELARGIHPAVLTERGLAPAIDALADRATFPVRVLETPAQRLPAQVETAAYFIVAEALTNAAKHARARDATVRIEQHNGSACVEVVDDGVGGADAARGSGLRGLADRLAALDGQLSVISPSGGGTRLTATIPCA
jgi:signal transduction histidine kinase